MTIFYIYEVLGEKNGATKDWEARYTYNFNKYLIEPVVIETMEGPDTPEMWQIVGDREWELADLNGYPRGRHYLSLRVFQLKQNTPEARQKMSDVAIGRTHSEESKLKISISNKGKVRSEESKIKMSITNKGTTRKALRTLTFKQAEEIRFKYIPHKYSTYKLAKEYGVSQRNIFQILNNLTYTK